MTGASAALPSGMPDEVGIYFQKNGGGDWGQVMPEVVNWQTGGVLKELSTVGIVKAV